MLFLNPDVVIHPGTLDRLATILDTHPEAWGAVPWFLNPDGTRQNFWRRFPGGFVTFFCFTRLGKRLDRLVGSPMMRYRNMLDLPDPPGIVQTIGVGAACFLVRREEFLDAGAFDEWYFNFFQDGEIQRTKYRQGRHVLGVGDATVTHTMGVTTRKMPSGKLDGEFLYGLRQFLAGAGLGHRILGEAAIRLDLLLPRRDRSEVRRAALRSLNRK